MLQVKNIKKSFSSAFEPIINKMSFELKKGDFCVVIGSNGSGKSTLIKSISGEYVLDSGKIMLSGNDLTHEPLYKRARLMSSVSQDVTKGTTQEMTLLENLSLSNIRGKKAGFHSISYHRRYLTTKIAELGLGLEQYMHTPMSALSGGQRQMIATVMAVLSSPTLLLLDEHCSALDPKTQIKVMSFTAQMIADGQITALMITHNLADAIKFGNRLMMLHQGNIVMDVSGEQKQAMNVHQLLEIFHSFEENNLHKAQGEN